MATVRLQLRRGTASEWDAANPRLAAGEIGIETDTNTFKFGDGATLWNDLSYALSDTVDDYVLLNTKGVANGVASLDSSGLIPASQLPPLAKVTVSAVANQAARLALTAEAGDIAIQSDNGQSYVLSASPASTDSNWKALVGSEAVVDTVEASLIAGTGLDKTYDDAAGTITIDIDSTVATKTYADQAEADAVSTAAADATSKANAAQAAAEATAAADATTKANAAQAAAISAAATDATTKANAAQTAASTALTNHEADTTGIHGIADTSILATTTGTQTLTNKTLTSPVINTPTGIVKADIALGNVDNTADMDKPVSYASLTALALKAPLASPGITGNATAENLTISGNLIVNGTTSTINSTTLTIQDKDIVLGQTSSPTDAAANGGGIVLKGTTDKSITYNVANSAWDLSENINIPSGKTITINNVPVLSINQVLGKSLPGEVVGTTEAQVLSNKTLEAPVINGTISLPSTTSIGDVSSSEIALLNGVSSNVQTQIDAKSPLASPTFTGIVSLPSTTSIGDVSATEIALLNGVTANVQTQIDAKSPTDSPAFTGTVSLPSTTSIGDVSATEIALLDGVTANVQTQINSKISSSDAASTYSPLASPTFSGTVTLPSTTSIGNVSSTEIGYLDGLGSNLQTQIDSKLASATAASTYAPLVSPTFSGTVTLPSTTSIGDVSISELALLDGVTSNVQAQIDAKSPTASPTFSGVVTLPSTTSIGLVSSTELELLNGLSANVQTQIDSKAPLNSPTFTGTVTLPANTISQSMMGDDSVGTNEIGGLAVTTEKIADAAVTTDKLANDSVTSGKIVAGTIVNSDINASAAIAQSKIDGLGAALDLKAPLENPTFTGTVSGITKSMVGLANVDNTTDALKPVSTATQTALDLKANSASPTFTGTVTLPSGTVTSGMIADGAIVNADINASAAIAQSKIDGLEASLAAKADLASPTFTGTVVLPTVTAGGSIVPGTDNIYDLGSPTKMWKDIYVGPGSLYVNGQKVIQDESGAIVVSADANENLGLRTSGSGNIELDPTGTGSVLVKGPLVVEAGANFSSADGNGITFSNGLKSDTLESKTLNTDLSLSGNGTGKVYLNDNAEVNGNLVVGGNLTVSGTTTTVNSETISLADNIIDLNSNFTTGTPTENAGIKIKRGDSSDVQMRWNESTDKWEFTNDGTNYSVIAPTNSPTFTGTVTIPAGASISGFAPLASPTFTGTVTVAASGVAFTDGTQTKEGVPSQTPIIQKTESYTLSSLTERDDLIEMNSASALTLTIPPASSVDYPIGTSLDILQTGVGQVTIAAGAGVTVNATPGLKLRTQWSSATLFKRAANTWVVFGDLTA